MNYYEIMICGDEDEKRKQNFEMMDLNREGKISKSTFKEFVTKSFPMYSNSMTDNIEIDEYQIEEIFNDIS